MTRIVGYSCSDDTLTQSLIEELDGEFVRAENGDDDVGRGFGWLKDGRSLLRKQPPQGRGTVNLGDMMADIPSRQMVGFERACDRGGVDTLDLQPYSFRTWVYVQSASVGEFEERRDEVLADIPDYIRRNIDGDTSEELCFHLFLTALQDRGGFGLSESDPRACAGALADTARNVESYSEGVDRPGAMVAVSERLLVGLSTDGPLWVRQFEGIDEQHEEPLFAGHRPQTESHPHFRAVLLSNEARNESDGWTKIPEREVVWIGGDWEIHSESMEELSE